MIFVVSGTRYLREGRFLDDSEIFFVQTSEDGEPLVRSLPTAGYPAEQPVLLKDDSGTIHFLWGDRRQDPDFEQWQTERPQVVAFSTDVIYSRLAGNVFEESKSIYEGHLQKIMGGYGDITFPIRLIEDDQNQLHTIFVADSTFKTSTTSGEEVIAGSLRVIHLSQTSNGKWNEADYLVPGVEPDIVSLPGNRMVLAFLGSTQSMPGFQNVLVITSDDNGLSWSKPTQVFLSNQNPSRMLSIKKGPDERIHLIWGRQTRGLPVPNEMWHSFSEDGGNTWSSPERFFEPEQTSGSEKIIGDFGLIVDQFGQLHWSGVVREVQGNGVLNFMTWNPTNKRWGPVENLEFAKNPRQDVELSINETTDKLYLFWDEMGEDAIYYSVKEITEIVTQSIIGKSGPLQLHANYPNPFNPSTRISFTLEEPAEVVLTVFDISGRQIMQKDLGSKPAGLHSEQISLEGLTSGTYIYEVELNNTWRQQSTMMLIK
ncbi:MAG: T9SS type A sorting domain-containing protein [Balneolaceae bacterium]|nr:T9SS type A sorting domain-containing protein [Balneolaceae bacterium]